MKYFIFGKTDGFEKFRQKIVLNMIDLTHIVPFLQEFWLKYLFYSFFEKLSDPQFRTINS